MKRDDMILISVDDHVIEPPDMFVGRLPKKYEADAPRLEHQENGTDVWKFRDHVIPNSALNAIAGRPKEEYGLEPQGLDEIRPGCFDVHERVKDMSAGGLLTQMCFPSFPGFAGRLFATEDKDFSRALVQAYNDWHIEGWAGAYPGRFIPMALPMIWDPADTADEVRRVAEKGCHSITFTENPAVMGFPSFHSDHWDPLWRALSDTGTVLNVHIGSSGRIAVPAADGPPDVMITLQPINIVQAAADLLWSRVLRKFPGVTFALSEGGIGWIPYFLERADRVYKQHRAWTHQDFGDRLPSEVFLERVVTCFIADDFGVASRDRLNLDMVTWECDYPHSDSMWPGAPESLAASLDGVPKAEADKITYQNALRIFSFDPFSHVRKEDATVGALRAQAKDVDLGYRSSPRLKKEGTGPVSVLDLASKLPSS
jgi:predicted TIM-barrel fold metal-dependent hydrolase